MSNSLHKLAVDRLLNYTQRQINSYFQMQMHYIPNYVRDWLAKDTNKRYHYLGSGVHFTFRKSDIRYLEDSHRYQITATYIDDFVIMTFDVHQLYNLITDPNLLEV